MFVFIDIWFGKQDIQKWLKRYAVFVDWRVYNWTRKGKTNFELPNSNQRFSVIFPPMIWIFMEGEGDEIKSKQASKRDRNNLVLALMIFWLKCQNIFVVLFNTDSTIVLCIYLEITQHHRKRQKVSLFLC